MILHCSIVPGSKGAQMDYSVLGIILLATQRLNYLLPLISEVIKEVTMRHVLRDETERLLDGDTAYEVDNVIVVAFRYLLHHLYLGEEVCPLLSSSRIYGNQRTTHYYGTFCTKNNQRDILQHVSRLRV